MIGFVNGGYLVKGRPASYASAQIRHSSFARRVLVQRAKTAPLIMMAAQSLHEVKMRDIDGNTVDFSSLKGRVVLAMNVACQCGYTQSGYTAMKNVANKYGDKVRVIAFPSNEFGMQEPGSPEEIKAFVNSKFGNPNILIMEKSSVKGSSANDVFKFAKASGAAEPGWNFDGRLIFDKQGKLAKRLGNSSMEYDITGEIDKLL
eukprot:Plantae.Rhodophyta-Purpureofilum_apyrenoidigerum.ctg118.p1 GENE.Plantae.Rhodophyta-Purpureofilum_apyrenoidigerum.ctg118~~Plantae.Rhodophyta-Purpureofilum_apyrenoidigerum.ctg118.p1  ORF type:complete len:203 (+),score=42.27 Plantae.Rhodophyta-Purpureofilum_apyrenoidigerum.ctg118:200-808(+)